jgi:hypothetical protein
MPSPSTSTPTYQRSTHRSRNRQERLMHVGKRPSNRRLEAAHSAHNGTYGRISNRTWAAPNQRVFGDPLMAKGARWADTGWHCADRSLLLTCHEDVSAPGDMGRYWTVRRITRRSQVQILPRQEENTWHSYMCRGSSRLHAFQHSHRAGSGIL